MYTKKRSEFGRQPLFTDLAAQLNVDIEPDDSVKDDFIEKNPVDMAIQYAPEMSEHEVRIKPTSKHITIQCLSLCLVYVKAVFSLCMYKALLSWCLGEHRAL